MIYTPMTKLAMKLCFEAHKEQTDKSGMPYVFHPFHLAEQMKDEETTVVALLHDLIEDTDHTLDDLREIGFSERIISAIELMTHAEGVPYMEYVAKIKGNPIARAVKLADLKHNSDLSRLDTVSEKDLERVEKYKRAIALLEQE
ncbi:MAG: GTP pyrophosphokinase [Clostridia bacterium]|nr:GTP pyrophosphokinase [Clostridia bacterium]